MRRYLFILIFFSIVSNVCFAQRDTTYNEYDGTYSIGKHTKNRFRKGVWLTYDKNNQLIEKSRYKFFYKHGKSIKYMQDSTSSERYYYDLTKEERSKNGKKILAYYFYGIFPQYDDCDKYSFTSIRVAGDAIWTGIIIRVYIHNTLIDIRQIMRFGFKYKKSECR